MIPMNIVKSKLLAAVAEQYPAFDLQVRIELSLPYNGSTYNRSIVANAVADVFADADITNSRTTEQSATEIMIVLCCHNGAYDVYPRIYALETAMESLLDSADENECVSEGDLDKAKAVLSTTLGVPTAPKPQEPCGKGIGAYVDYLAIKDLALSVSVDVGSCDDEEVLRLFSTNPKGIEVNETTKTVTLVFDGHEDNYQGLTRVIELETQLEKLINSAHQSKTKKLHLTQVRRAISLLSQKLITC